LRKNDFKTLPVKNNYLTIVIFNSNKDILFEKVRELGKVEIDDSKLYNLAEGSIITDSVAVDYFSDNGDINLIISEFKVMKTGEEFNRVKDATEKTIYRWDIQQNKFVQL